jgi:hypothetical protein
MFRSVHEVFVNVREGSRDVRDVRECSRSVRDVREVFVMFASIRGRTYVVVDLVRWSPDTQVKMFMKLCFHHNSVNSQPISLTFGVICSWKIGASNGTESPVHNQLQPVFYRLLFMGDLRATATATDPDPGQLDLKSGLLQSIFAVQSSPVASPYDRTFKH